MVNALHDSRHRRHPTSIVQNVQSKAPPRSHQAPVLAAIVHCRESVKLPPTQAPRAYPSDGAKVVRVAIVRTIISVTVTHKQVNFVSRRLGRWGVIPSYKHSLGTLILSPAAIKTHLCDAHLICTRMIPCARIWPSK